MSIQMNQTDEHEHKLVLLGSKLDEKSGKACAGKKTADARRAAVTIVWATVHLPSCFFFPRQLFRSFLLTESLKKAI